METATITAAQNAYNAAIAASQTENRITSYNVCYTKLLRRELSVDLTPEEEVTMRNFFVEKLGLEIDESDPTKSEKAAYDVLAASYALMK